MLQKLKAIIQTATLRQSAITVSSIFLSAFLGAVFYLVLAKLLTTSEYGLFSLGLIVLQLAVTVADLGMGQGIVKFIGKYKSSNDYFPYAKLSLLVKLSMGALIMILLVLFSDLVSNQVFHQPLLKTIMPAIGIGVLATLLFGFCISVFQGLQKFALWGSFQVLVNVLRLFIVGLLFVVSSITPFSSLMSYFVSMFIFFFLSWYWISPKLINSPITSKHTSSFFSFNFWTAAFSISATFVNRIDTFLISRYLDLTAIGIYSLATTMQSFMAQLSTAMGAVTSAKFASFQDPKSANKYILKSTMLSLGVGVCTLVLMVPVSLLVIHFTSNPDYQLAFTPFLILVISSLIFTTLNPVRDCILYFYGRSDFFFGANLVQGIVLLVAGLFLVPGYGLIGSATSVLLSQLAHGGVCLSFYLSISGLFATAKSPIPNGKS